MGAETKTALFARNQPGGMFTIESQDFTTGSHYFVHSTTGTDGAGYGRHPDTPCATIDYAIALCTASKGDIIHVMPGHTETIASATGMVCDVIGITIRGVSKNPGMMPKITLGTADTTLVSVTAAGVTLENLWFVANFLNIASMISVAAVDCVIRGCRLTETGGNLNAKIGILTGALVTTNRLTVEDCYFNLPDTDNTAGISMPGTPDGVIIRRNIMYGDWGSFAIGGVGVVTNCTIADNVIYNAASDNNVCVNLPATATGMMMRNLAGGVAAAANGFMFGDGTNSLGAICENYYMDIAVDRSGLLEPVVT